MKKIISFILTAAVVFTGCKYDDDDLWNKVNELDGRVASLETSVSQMNTNISSLQTLIDAVNKNLFVTSYGEMTDEDGWELTLSNGETIKIFHGSAGTNAPVVGVKQHEDGVYYWTLDGEWLYSDEVNEVKIPVTGEKGEHGSDAVTPVIGIDGDGHWTVDTGNGPVVVEGPNGPVTATVDGVHTIFTDVVDNGLYYSFIQADGNEIQLMKRVVPTVVIEAEELEYFQYGEFRTFNVTIENSTGASVSAPFGWTAAVDRNNGLLYVQASSGPITSGEVIVSVYGDGATVTASFDVYADSYQLRYLTFEDEDYKGGSTNYWTSLIDNPQYQGPLLYDGKTAGSSTTLVNYSWNDEGNTYLASKLLGNHGGYYDEDGEPLYEWWTWDYSGGGEAISNYSGKPILGAGYPDQLSIPYPSGRRGSENFCVHFGYDDGTMVSQILPAIFFSDGTARVVDHMWVTSTCYFLETAMNGNSFVSAIAEDGYVDIVAIGWPTEDAGDDQKTTVTFRLADGRNGLIQDWQKWDDLHLLGPVVKIEFNMEGSKADNWKYGGFARPAYFAFDDVAVRF